MTTDLAPESNQSAGTPRRRLGWHRRHSPVVAPNPADFIHRAVGLDEWSYANFFPRPLNRDWDACIPGIEAYIASIPWTELPFFERAVRGDASALLLWTSQEIVTTNAFAQVVLAAASNIRNVHLRTVLSTVAQGEHGWVDRDGYAVDSHPWLLHLLRESLNIPAGTIEPLPPTRQFISFMTNAVVDPLTAIAVIGVGNERLLIPEYQEIEALFRQMLPDARFRPFLEANLKEDQVHYRLCYDTASQLIAMGGGAARKKFNEIARASIHARLEYLEQLANYQWNQKRMRWELMSTPKSF